MSEFGENINFVNILNLARKDNIVLDALKADDFSIVDAYPGLSTRERKLLKSLNWKKTNLAVRDSDAKNFAAVSLNASVCERSIATDAVEAKCYVL